MVETDRCGNAGNKAGTVGRPDVPTLSDRAVGRVGGIEAAVPGQLGRRGPPGLPLLHRLMAIAASRLTRANLVSKGVACWPYQSTTGYWLGVHGMGGGVS